MELIAVVPLLFFCPLHTHADLFSKHWLILYHVGRLSEHQSEASGCGTAVLVLKCI